MATATQNGNRIVVTVTVGKQSFTIDMSLQRHDYRYCGSAGAAAVNSLLYASVADDTVVAEGVEVGNQIESMLKAGAKYTVLFGKNLTVKSGRVYLVDNTALNPQGFPNHYFVTNGPQVWGNMTANEFTAASALRRVEEAIDARKARGDKTNYLDAKTLYAVQASAGLANPVIAAYTAAHTAFLAVPNADKQLGEVSGRPDIVALARKQY